MEKQIEKTNKQIEFYMKQANFITDKLAAYKIPILTNIKDSNRRLRIVQNIYIELIKKINNNRITWSKAIKSYNNIIRINLCPLFNIFKILSGSNYSNCFICNNRQ